MKLIITLILFVSLTIFSCSRNEKTDEKATEKIEKVESLVEIENGIYTEYYPGRKQIKFQGEQDNMGNRQGKWTFYNETGIELSSTHYEHGKKHGASFAKYPNGVLHYIGEYENDKEVGIWKMYDENGNLATEKDYSKP
jgi:antitoxin component YwqK of YwqJK toxin-antitoxin module